MVSEARANSDKAGGPTVKKSGRKANKGSFNGKKPGPGRPKGVPNKVTQELGEAARTYTTAALETLYLICIQGESEQARVAAACAILDRGHGKPKQQQEIKMDGSEAFLKIWESISNGTAG